jgi:hypothetical protein
MTQFIYIPFTGLGFYNGFRGETWYQNRIQIFKDYTLKSLINQSNKDFIAWLSFRPEEKYNILTNKIKDALEKSGLNYVMTFNGVMFHDDRGVEHNIDLKERIGDSMDTLKPFVKGDWVYETLLGSDDMFAKDVVKEIQQQEPAKNKVLYFQKGYIYNTSTNELCEWNRPDAAAKYTIIYPSDIFLDEDKHYNYIKGLTSHERVFEIFKGEKLTDRQYCATVNGYNISTIWNHPYRGKEVNNKLLKDKFGI